MCAGVEVKDVLASGTVCPGRLTLGRPAEPHGC